MQVIHIVCLLNADEIQDDANSDDGGGDSDDDVNI